MMALKRFFILQVVAASFFAPGVLRAGETVDYSIPVEEMPAADAPAGYLPKELITIETQDGHDYIFDVEMAADPAQRERGLMFRTRMNNDSGMLFVFEAEDSRSFWMKNTLIPLDMIFIGRDGVINHVHHNAKPQDETRITSDSPALAVLEVNGGLAGTLGIKEGDKVLHPLFRNVLDKP